MSQPSPTPHLPCLPHLLQDLIQTGVSAADRTMKAQLVGELRSLVEARAGPNGVRIADLLDAVNAQSSVRVSERDLRLALNELVSGG